MQTPSPARGSRLLLAVSFLLGNLILVVCSKPANAEDAIKLKSPAGVYALASTMRLCSGRSLKMGFRSTRRASTGWKPRSHSIRSILPIATLRRRSTRRL